METSRRSKEEQGLKPYSSQSKPQTTATTAWKDRPPPATQDDQVKLAATAIRSNVRLRSSDMPIHMQELAFRLARSFADSQTPNNHRISLTLLARTLKKEFDNVYGPAWHCVVGKSFGSFVTHSPTGFIYFSMDSLFILLFKTEVQLATE